jgi:ferredoxin
MTAVVNEDLCTGCGVCVDVCPPAAITMEDDIAVVDPNSCIDCQACVPECAFDAITME